MYYEIIYKKEKSGDLVLGEETRLGGNKKNETRANAWLVKQFSTSVYKCIMDSNSSIRCLVFPFLILR